METSKTHKHDKSQGKQLPGKQSFDLAPKQLQFWWLLAGCTSVGWVTGSEYHTTVSFSLLANNEPQDAPLKTEWVVNWA